MMKLNPKYFGPNAANYFPGDWLQDGKLVYDKYSKIICTVFMCRSQQNCNLQQNWDKNIIRKYFVYGDILDYPCDRMDYTEKQMRERFVPYSN